MGIIKEKTIRGIFKESKNQHEVALKLYKIAYSNWDSIKSVKSYPEAGELLSKLIWELFMDFDKKYHPNVMAAGLWLNQGFSTNKKLNDWEITTENSEVVYIN